MDITKLDKHLLLFSDGDDAEERNRAPVLVASAKRQGITTSVVATTAKKISRVPSTPAFMGSSPPSIFE